MKKSWKLKVFQYSVTEVDSARNSYHLWIIFKELLFLFGRYKKSYAFIFIFPSFFLFLRDLQNDFAQYLEDQSFWDPSLENPERITKIIIGIFISKLFPLWTNSSNILLNLWTDVWKNIISMKGFPVISSLLNPTSTTFTHLIKFTMCPYIILWML